MLRSIAERDVPIPKHLDIFYLDKEAPPVDLTPQEFITKDIEEEQARLEAEADEIVCENPEDPRLDDIYERLEDLEPELAIPRAAKLLYGLGFKKAMQAKPCKEFSGGWRMRVALAKALFYRPAILLLDDPTAHLDLEAVIWLEAELSEYPNCLVLVSHSADFLNAVCNKVMLLEGQKLSYFSGNYDMFLKTKQEHDTQQMAQYNKEQATMNQMKDYVARFGHGTAKHARQAKSREKKLNRMVSDGLTEKVEAARTLQFRFPECRKLPPPVLQINGVSFGYPGCELLYKDLWLSLDQDSRICLVGSNGAGKSTLMKLFSQELDPTSGDVRAHTHLRVARYHQHLAESLDLNATPLEFLMAKDDQDTELSEMRQKLGTYGVTGPMQVTRMAQMSDGERCRVCFAWIALQRPNMLMLDEPTNALDLETIDSLAEAVKAFDGGVLVVSHDFRLISQIADEIWICENGGIERYPRGILEYKEEMRKKLIDKMQRRQARLEAKLGKGRVRG